MYFAKLDRSVARTEHHIASQRRNVASCTLAPYYMLKGGLLYRECRVSSFSVVGCTFTLNTFATATAADEFPMEKPTEDILDQEIF